MPKQMAVLISEPQHEPCCHCGATEVMTVGGQVARGASRAGIWSYWTPQRVGTCWRACGCDAGIVASASDSRDENWLSDVTQARPLVTERDRLYVGEGVLSGLSWILLR